MGLCRKAMSHFTRHVADDDGYTIVEVLIALTVLSLVLLAAEWGAIGSMAASTAAKEHSVATGLVTSVMAEAVSLPFEDLENGLNPDADCGSPSVNCLSHDPYVAESGSSYVVDLDGEIVPSSGSTIPVANTATAEQPFVPETSTVVEGVTYTVHAYPTVSSAAPGIVTVIAIVTWKAPTGATEKVVGEDGVAAP